LNLGVFPKTKVRLLSSCPIAESFHHPGPLLVSRSSRTLK